jgi:hypothetical protein
MDGGRTSGIPAHAAWINFLPISISSIRDSVLAMVRAFLAMIFREPEVTIVQADPDPNNHRAIRCYAKAGFTAVGQVVTPDGMALLMRCRRAS